MDFDEFSVFHDIFACFQLYIGESLTKYQLQRDYPAAKCMRIASKTCQTLPQRARSDETTLRRKADTPGRPPGTVETRFSGFWARGHQNTSVLDH